MDAEQRVTRYKNLMTEHHDVMIKPSQFNIVNLILKRVSLDTKDPTQGKLGPIGTDHCRHSILHP